MKAIIFGLVLSISTTLFSATFTTTTELSTQTESYTLPKTMKVQVLDVNPHTDTAEIKVNNEIRTYQLKFLRSDVDAYENIYTYSTVLGTTVLANGSSCDEFEDISFKLVLAVEDEPRDPHTAATFKEISLSAIYSYSWDVCHGPLETKVINYTKK